MQRKPITVLCAWIMTLVFVGTTQAQYVEYSLHASTYDFKRELLEWNPMNPELSFPDAIGLGYSKQITPFLSYYIPVHVGQFGFGKSKDPGTKYWFFDGDLAVKLEVQNHARWVSPYLWAGVGGYYVLNDPNGEGLLPKIPLGIGVNVKLYKRLFADVYTSYARNIGINRGHFTYGVGLKYILGTGIPRKVIPVPVKIAMDRDADGVPDGEDHCPELAGLAAFDGCPDTDGDLIPDPEDKCPEVAGIQANGGCPLMPLEADTNKKQTEENDSELAMKAADTDGDGVPDHLDFCPEKAGSPSNNGCPQEAIVVHQQGEANTENTTEDIHDQTKKDVSSGIAKDEQSTHVKDKDNDGIPDAEDGCPELAGVASNHGCPEVDSDGDGVPNSKDKCPHLAGSVFNHGCPEMPDQETALANSESDEKKPDQLPHDHMLHNGKVNQPSMSEKEDPSHAETRAPAATQEQDAKVKKSEVKPVLPTPSDSKIQTQPMVRMDTIHKQIIIVDTLVKKVVVYDTVKKRVEVPARQGETSHEMVLSHQVGSPSSNTREVEPTGNAQEFGSMGGDEGPAGEEVHFVFRNKVGALDPVHIHILDRVVSMLKEHPDVRVVVSASANEYRYPRYNVRLANKRIRAIAKYMEIRHIDSGRIVRSESEGLGLQGREGAVRIVR